ncbi:MAG: hypothetical protein ACREBO_01150, partial [Novosphingobium sp.]
MIHLTVLRFTAAALALGLAVPALAGGPYYVKFLGRDPGNGAAASEGKKDFYKGWIELNSSSVQDGNT